MSTFLSKGYADMKNIFAGTVLGDTGFFFHFWSYVLVNAILIAINLLVTPHHLWFFWPLLGWGIGLLAHGLAIHFSQREAVRRRAHTRDARLHTQH